MKLLSKNILSRFDHDYNTQIKILNRLKELQKEQTLIIKELKKLKLPIKTFNSVVKSLDCVGVTRHKFICIPFKSNKTKMSYKFSERAHYLKITQKCKWINKNELPGKGIYLKFDSREIFYGTRNGYNEGVLLLNKYFNDFTDKQKILLVNFLSKNNFKIEKFSDEIKSLILLT